MAASNRGKSILGVILRFVALLGLTALPFITGQAMNIITEGGAVEELTRWAIFGAIAGIVYLVFSFLSDRTFARLATGGLYKLQTTLFANIQTLSMGFFYKNPPGELSSNVTNDAEVVSLFYTSAVSQLIRAVLQIFMILIVMLLINWQLTIVALLTVPLLLAAIYVVTRIASPAFAKLQETLGDASGFQEETLTGHKVIISKRRQDWATAEHEVKAAEVHHVGTRAFFAALMQFPATQTLNLFQNVFVMLVGTFMVIGGKTDLGTVMAFSGYSALLASPLAQIANLITNALNASAGGERVFKIIDEVPVVEDAPDAVDYEFKGGRIEFKDVDFSYVPGSKILRNNTFDVQPGESIGICGPTGAGKSTLINILTRYYDIDSGTILVDGQDLSKLTQRSLRRQVGVVLQEAFLFTDTVMNNLKYAREGATDEEAIEAAKKANAHDFIMALPQGYDTLLTERGANLSQGQRQMITIARAMVADPKIVDPGRGHQQRRHPHRKADPGRHAQPDGGQDQLLHRPPPGHHPRFEQDHGRQRRRDRRDGLARRADGQAGILLYSVHEPVQGQSPGRLGSRRCGLCKHLEGHGETGGGMNTSPRTGPLVLMNRS